MLTRINWVGGGKGERRRREEEKEVKVKWKGKEGGEGRGRVGEEGGEDEKDIFCRCVMSRVYNR